MFSFLRAIPFWLCLLGLLSFAGHLYLAPAYTPSLTPAPAAFADGQTLGGDFRLFWGAGKLAVQGKPEAAYNAQTLREVSGMGAMPIEVEAKPFYYPPTALLYFMPFGKLSYAEAWYVYSWLSLALLLATTALAFPRHLYFLPFVLGFGGVWACMRYGQSTLLLASFYMALAGLARWPRLGGLTLALASFKPHLSVLAPLVLLWRGQYRVFVWATMGVLALAGGAYVLLGPAVFEVYSAALLAPTNRLLALREGQATPMITLYAGLSRLGIAPLYALAAHAVLALLGLGLLWSICQRAVDPQLPLAALVATGLLVSPHAYAYDLVLLALPLLVLTRRVMAFGAGFEDILILAVLYLSPFFVREMNMETIVSFVPLLLLLLLWRLNLQSRGDSDA